jgi:ATP adenylyltransferase
VSHDAIWAPWRRSYLRELSVRASEATRALGDSKGSPNFLADYWAHPERDTQQHVVMRSAHGMILLNRYPYSNGHLLVALGEPRPTLLDYDAPQRAELWRLVDIATDLVQRALNPQGVNIGVNQGVAAGAGLPEHLHVHVVPRWSGDTNFMPVIGQVRVIPDALDAMYASLRAAAAARHE